MNVFDTKIKTQIQISNISPGQKKNFKVFGNPGFLYAKTNPGLERKDILGQDQ